MNTRGTIKAMDKFFTGSTVKHLAFNYSQSEVGLRHPDGPIGIMARDQGQLDAYAGRARTLWLVDGLCISLARCWGVIADRVVLRVPDVHSLVVNGRVLSRELHAGQDLCALRKPLTATVGFVDKDLQIDTKTGKILSGFLPVTDYIEPRKIFEQDLGNDILPSKDERRYVLWSRALGGNS